MRKLLWLSIALVAVAAPVRAADMAVKAPPLPVVSSKPVCTLTSCTGFFGGAMLDEAGGNFNLVATGVSGVAQNQFAAGVRGGWQYWDTKWFARGEVIGMYGLAQNGNLPGQGNKPLWSLGVLAKIGYNFLGQTAPNSVPFLPTGLAIISPYAIVGDWTRPWGSGFAAGGGIEGLLAKNLTVSVDAIHVNYNNALVNANVKQQTEDLVLGGIDWHFGM
jgi:hypothetical protein